jgi:hypothetical protein
MTHEAAVNGLIAQRLDPGFAQGLDRAALAA